MIGLYGEFSTSMIYIGGEDAARLLGGYIPPEFAPMLIEFLKNINKSRDKSLFYRSENPVYSSAYSFASDLGAQGPLGVLVGYY